MLTIDTNELAERLRNVKGTTAVTLTICTVPDMNKTGNPYYGRVSKYSTLNVMIGFVYETSVNNQRCREGREADFESMPRKWGVRIQGTPLVENKGSLYLECKIQRVLETYYTLDGDEFSAEDLQPWLRKPSQADRQGVDAPVVLRDIKLENILEVRMFGEVFCVEKGVCSHA